MALFASAGSSEAAVRNVPVPYATLGDAVSASDPGDTIQIASGTSVLTSAVTINKANLIIQGAAALQTTLQVSHTDTPAILITASGVTIRDLKIEKTTKTGPQNLIGVQASNTTIEDCEIFGQYVLGDDDVSRAFEVSSGLAGLLIQDNVIYGLRQPGYLNGSLDSPTTGTIANNVVYGTRGWVVDGANVTFTDNSWGSGNAVDIAILSGTPAGYYPALGPIATANNDAVMQDQRPGGGFSVQHVDAAAALGGDGTYLKPLNTITSAFLTLVSGGKVKVRSGTYNEQIVVTKPLSIVGATTPTKPVLNFTGTPTGKLTLIDVWAANVTVQNFQMDVDMSKLNSAIIASRMAPATTINGLQVLDNVITPYASAAGPAVGSYGNQNAIGINYGPLRVSGGGGHVTVSGNVIRFRQLDDEFDDDLPVNGEPRIFRSGVSIDECGGTFSNNVIQSKNQDVLARFGSAGQVITINGNTFKGGGVELAEHNAGVTGLSVVDNSFDAELAVAVVTPRTAVLRLKNNQTGIPTTISDNIFTKHNWAISLENYKNVTVSGNAFTPGAVSSYRHITVNTKCISSNSASIVQTTISANITGNIFNDSAPSSPGTAIAFYNHDSDAAAFGAFTVTGNTFNAGIGTFILLDGNSGNTPGPFPEYTGVSTLMAPWVTNIDASNNEFDVGSGAKSPSAMSNAELFALEDRISHRSDAAGLGVVRVKATELYVTATGSIQRMIGAAAAGDIVNVGPGTYSEDISVNKSITLKGSGSNDITTIVGPIGGAGSTVTFATSNATVEGFKITRAGNNPTDWMDNSLKTAGVAIQGQGITGNIIRNNWVYGMRTGIDINNSNGHSVLNNRISSSRTGMILRNQTDNLVVEQNEIINNHTAGVLFLNANGGSNSPVQTAVNCQFFNNNISGNWFGQIVDRQTGGDMPAPGDNVKNLSGNWFGTATPVVSAANSAEGGYTLATMPRELGGTYDGPVPGSQPDICGPASANFDITPLLIVGTDTNVETSPGRGTLGFQGDFTSPKLVLTCPQDGALTYSRIQEVVDFIKTGGIVQVPAATYPGNVNTSAKSVTLAAGSSPGKVVIDGDLVLDGNDTLPIEVGGTIAGTQHDQWEVTGAVTLGGASVTFTAVALAPDPVFVPASGNAFTFLSNTGAGAIVGEFNGLPQNAGLPAFLGSASDAYATYTAGDGNDFVVSVGPELVVEQGAPMGTGDQRNFGVVPTQGGFKTMTFTLRNIGAPGLSISPVQVSGSSAFTVIQQPASPVTGPLGSTTFTVQFAPLTTGEHVATLSIQSNDIDSPFEISLIGEGVDANFYNDNGTVIVGLPTGGTLFRLTANETTYTLERIGGSGNWAGINDGLVSGHTSATLTIQKADLTQVIIGDGTTAANLTITSTTGENYEHTFQVTLDHGPTTAGTFTFTGNSAFINNSSFIGSTTRNSAVGFTVNTGVTVSAAGTGSISMTAAQGITLSGSGSVTTAAGNLALSGTAITLNTGSITSVDGDVTLTASTGAINTGANSQIRSTGGGAVTLTAGGSISTGSPSFVTTNTGDLTITAATTFAPGTATFATAGSGNLLIQSGGSWNNSATTFTATTESGSMTLKSTGANVRAGASTLTTTGGNLELNAFTAVDTGNNAVIKVNGAGGTLKMLGGSGFSTGTGADIATQGGAIDLKVTGAGAGNWSVGANSTIASSGGAISMRAGPTTGTWTLGAAADIIAAGGNVEVIAGGNIAVNADSTVSSTAGNVVLTAGTLNTHAITSYARSSITAGGTITATAGGAITIGTGSITLADDKAVVTGGGLVTLDSNLAGVTVNLYSEVTSAGGVTLEAQTSITTGVSSKVRSNGAGAVSLTATTANISIGNTAEVSSVGGDVSLIAATTFAPGTATFTTTGSGSLLIQSGGSWNNSATTFTATTESGSMTLKSTGANVRAGASTLTTTGGNLELNAFTAVDTGNNAVIKVNGAGGTLKMLGGSGFSTGTGAEIATQGGAIDLKVTGAGAGNWSVGANSTIASSGGAISMRAGTTNTSTWTLGAAADITAAGGHVEVVAGGAITVGGGADTVASYATVTTTGAGTIDLTSTAANISTNPFARVTTGGGSLTLDAFTSVGTGSTSLLRVTGAGTLSLLGDTTVTVGADSIVESTAGNVVLTTGTLAAHSFTANRRSSITAGGTITATAGGAITIGENAITLAADKAVVTGGGLVTLDSNLAGVTVNLYSEVTSAGGVTLEAQTSITTGVSSKVRSTGAGAVSLTATTANISIGNTAEVSSVGGDVSLIAATTFAPGTATFTTTGSGDLLIQSGGTWNSSVTAFTATTAAGDVTLKSTGSAISTGASIITTTGGDIGLEGTSLTTGASSLIEVAGEGNIALTSTTTTIMTGADSTLRVVNGQISATSAQALTVGSRSLTSATGTGSIVFSAGSTITTNVGIAGTPTTLTRLSTSGTGGITLITPRDIVINNESTISVVNGDVLLSANQQTVPTGASFHGINSSGKVVSSGSGDIQLLGKGGNASGNRGILLNGSGAGRGEVLSEGSGTISLEGTTTAVMNLSDCYGVQLTGSNTFAAAVKSGTGGISIVGVSHAGGTGTGNVGVYLAAGAQVSSLDENAVVPILINGRGADSIRTVDGGANYGVWLTGAGTKISTVKGTIDVTGRGGDFTVASAGDNQFGIYIVTDAQISSSGSANISLTGTAGTGGDDNQIGVYINGNSGSGTSGVSSKDGNILITGTSGGSDGNSLNADGVRLEGGRAEVISTGSGVITITGTRPVAATAGFAFNALGSSKVTLADTGGVIVNADTISIANNCVLNMGGNAITLKPSTAGRVINLGAADSATQLGLTDAELDRITAGTITLGNGDAGNITVSAVIDRIAPATPTHLELVTGHDIIQSALVNAGGTGSVTFTAVSGSYYPGVGAANADVIAATTTVTPGTKLPLSLESYSASSPFGVFDRLNVNGGSVNIAGAVLELPPHPNPNPNYTPVLGHTFNLVSSTGLLTGPFSGTPANDTYLNFYGSDKSAVLTYTANAAVLTITGQPEIAVHNGASTSDPEFTDADPDQDPVDFGTTTLGVPVVKDFTIHNPGTGLLTITSITPPPTGFTVLNAPASVPAGGSATFQVQLNGDVGTSFSGDVTITSDDPTDDEGVFTFPVTGASSTDSQQVVKNGSILSVGVANTLNTDLVITVSVPNNTTYTLARNTGNWTDPNILTLGSEGISGHNTSTLIIQKSQVTEVRIFDAEETPATGKVRVTFAGRGTALTNPEDEVSPGPPQKFDASFTVRLDSADAGIISFSGVCDFTGSNFLNASTHASIEQLGSSPTALRRISVEEGDLTLSANRGPVATAMAANGVNIYGTVETKGGGDVLISGRGGNATGGRNGVRVEGNAKISSTSEASGAGTITLIGTGSPFGATNSTAYGICLTGTAVDVSSKRGNILFTGNSASTGSGDNNHGIFITSGARVRATGTVADVSLTLNGNSAFASAASGSNYGVLLFGAGTEISSARGSIDVVGVSNAATSGPSNVGVAISSGAKVMASSPSTQPVKITITGDSAATTGASVNSHGVLITGTGAEVVSRDQPLSITGVSHSTAEGDSHRGVEISGTAKVHTEGVAALTITGEAGASTASSLNNAGILLSGTGVEVYTVQGDITLSGTSKTVSTGGSDSSDGVRVASGAKVRSEGTASGNIIKIQGNNAPRGGNLSSGVAIVGTGTEVLSARGFIDIDGESTGHASSVGASNMGVNLNGGAKIRSLSLSHEVAISIDGRGADSARVANGNVSNHGVSVTASGTQVQTAKGSITIRGFGGRLSDTSLADQNCGVRIADNVEISSTDDATILIEGTAGLGGDAYMIGVWLQDSSAHNTPESEWTRITSKSGLVTIKGTSGGTNAFSSARCDGVLLDSNGVRFYSETSADFDITGIKSPAAANTPGSAFVMSGAPRVISAGTGNVTVHADSIDLTAGVSGCQFDMGTSQVAFIPTSPDRPIEIGGTASPAETAGTVLGLFSGEIARVLSGTCVIGSTDAGPITVRGPVTMAGGVHLSLVSKGDIIQNNTANHTTTGTLATSGAGTVKLTSVEGRVKPLPDALPMAGVLPDVTGNLTFGAGTDLEIMIRGLTPLSMANSEDANGYRQLTVNGDLNIDGVNLRVTDGSYVPVIGDKFVIATAASEVTGMFANTLDDVVANINGSNFGGKIILNDGGNNVTLEIVGSPEIVVESNGPPVVELADGQTTPVSFGAPLYLTPVDKTFTLSNTGTETLKVTAIDVPVGYTLLSQSKPFPIEIAVGGAPEHFTVRFEASSVATFAGDVVIHSNDVDETLFNFPITGSVSNFATNNAGGGQDTVTVVAHGGRNITVRVPPASPQIGGEPGDKFYRLVLNTGTWNGSDVTNVVTGHGTNTLTIRKEGVKKVDIIDDTGANTVAFEGRAAETSGRTFDDDFTVLLDNAPSAGAVTFTGNCEFKDNSEGFPLTSSLNVETNMNITQNANTTLSVADGDLTLKAGYGTVPMSSNLDAIAVFGTVTTSGKGNILMTGRGSSSNQCWGITVGGVGGSSGKILSTWDDPAAGSITLNGAGGPNTGSSSGGYGVYLNGAAIEISSFRGAITVNGTSPALGTGGLHMGFVMRNGAQVIDRGSAAITLIGTGSTVAAANNNHGVWLSDTNTRVSALNGSITINGTGGGDGALARTNQRGVLIETNAQVVSTGTASITITGTGGEGNNNHAGVTVRGLGALVSSKDGNIVINGMGGGFNNVASNDNYGILIDGGTVSSTGAATIALNGTEGPSPTVLRNEGFAMLGAASKLTTDTGAGAVTITADKMAIHPTNATLALGTNSITLKPRSVGKNIDLGGADTASALGLTSGEINRITTAGTIIVGSADAGTFTISTAISPVSNANLSLISKDDIVQSSGGTLTTAGAVSFTSVIGKVQPTPAGLDVTASTVTFGNGTRLALPISALTPADSETGYRRLTVSNGVDLTGVELVDYNTGSVPTLALDDSFILVANNSTAPESTTVGTFNDLPEGDIKYNFLGSGMNARISYIRGTDANDVVFTIDPQQIAVGQPEGTGLVHDVSIVDFGAVNIHGLETKTFTITNLGAQDLAIGAITSDNAEFVVDTAGVSPSLVPGATTTFKVSFAPVTGGPGLRNGAIFIASDDPDPNLPIQGFKVQVTGTAISREAELVWAKQYSGPDVTPRNGDAKAVAVHQNGNTAVAVFATGYTTNAAGNKDIYVMKYDPADGTPDPVWTNQPDTIYNGPTNRDDEGAAIVVDSNGDVIVAGLTTVAPSNSDVWVAKYSGATGARLWSHTYNGYLNNVDYATSIAVDANDNVAVAGATVTGSGNYDMYVVKLSAAGAVIWENALDGGNNRSDIANKVLMDSAGNVFVAGYKGNSSNRKISFAAKLSAAAGNVLWTHQRVGSAVLDDMLYGLAVDANDNLVVAGSLYAAGSYDLYVAKLQGDSAGPAATAMWETVTDPFGNNDSFYDVVVDGDGHVVAAGTSRNASNLHERIVAKYDGSNGARLWDTRLNQGLSTSGDRAFNTQLALDGANNVAVTGFAISSANDGMLDVYTAKVLTADGALLWAKTHPSPVVAGKNDEGRDVAASFNGDFYVAGYSGNPSASTSDFLVMKYGVVQPVQQLPNPIVFTTEEIQSVGATVRLEATAPGGVVRYSVVSGDNLVTALSGPNSDTLTFIGVGQVVIRGSQGGNSQYAPATDTDLTITVRDSQTISFTLADSASKNSTVALVATASSGLPVSFSVQSGPGSITGGNTLEFSDAGEVVVRASQAGDNDYAAATPVDRAITVTDGAPVIIMPGIEQTWAAISPGTGAGQARSVALDMTGGVWNGGAVTTGFTTRAGTGVDLRTAKHDADGTLVWETIRSVNLADEGVMVKVDNDGNVFVAGYTTVSGTNTDVLVIKYDSAGVQQWQRTFTGTAAGGGADRAVGLMLTSAGDVVVAGYLVNVTTGLDFFAAKLNSGDGTVAWSQSYDGGFNKIDVVNALALTATDEVVLAGYSQDASNNEDALTLKVPAAGGAAIWTRRFAGVTGMADRINAVALGADGDVFVTGYTQGASIDIYSARYNGEDGAEEWKSIYNGPANKNDAAYDLKVDLAGNVVIAATASDVNAVNDGLTLKLNGTTGAVMWNAFYAGPAGKTDRMSVVGLDPNGHVIATGYSLVANNTSDIYTAKYDKNTGAEIWTIRYNGADLVRNDSCNAMVTDNLGGAWVAGYMSNTSNVTAPLLLRYAPPMPPPPPPPLDEESGESESSLVALGALLEVEQGDTANFNAEFAAANGNEEVRLQASINGQSAGEMIVDAKNGRFNWSQDTSRIAPGLHPVVITATDRAGSSTSVNLALQVKPSTPGRSWRFKNFGSTDATGAAADDADPDGDGLSNLAEFALGLNPKAGSGDTGIRAEAAPAAPDVMRAVFNRRTDHAAAGLRYVVEFSSNLTTWTASTDTPELLSDDGTIQKLSLPFPVLPDGSTARFFRVQIETVPAPQE